MVFKIVLLFSIISIMLILIWTHRTAINIKSILLILVYIYCVYLFTVSGRVNITNDNSINLIPGQSIYIMLTSPWNNRGGYEYVEIMGNIMLFIPVGMLLREWVELDYKKLFIVTLLFTFFIEFIQFYMRIGTFEIDDMLNNMWGAMVGADTTYAIKELKENKRIQSAPIMILLIFCLFALVLYLRFVLGMGVILKI